MLFVRPAPLNSGYLAVLIIPSVQAPSRAAGSFDGQDSHLTSAASRPFRSFLAIPAVLESGRQAEEDSAARGRLSTPC
jgi:hypothetical protein